MGAEAEDYAALGLKPGADLAAVDRAYRERIKAHHPDRPGGDPRRAAEINHAYKSLRQSLGYRGNLSLRGIVGRRPSRLRPAIWVGLFVALASATAALFISRISPSPAAATQSTVSIAAASTRVTSSFDVMDMPLNLIAMDAATKEARELASASDEMAMTAWSNDCYLQLREAPSVAQFDRCAAFDDAVVRIQNRDPLRDRGKFSEVAVTSRLWSSAASLSRDQLAIDSRIRRINHHVEAALTPVDANSAAL